MKKIIKQISIILLIMLIGTTFSAVNKSFAASINCVSSVTIGNDIVVSITGLKPEVVGYNADVSIKFADGTVKTGNLAKWDYLVENQWQLSCTFKAEVSGNATVTCTYAGANEAGVTIDNGTITHVVNIKCAHDSKKTEVIQNVSCTKDKIEATKCAKCGYEFERKTVEKAKGHTKGEAQVTKAETCCEDGLKTVKCTVCKEVLENITIKATGNHTYSNPCKKTKTTNVVTNATNTNKNNTTNTNKNNTTNAIKNNTTNTNKVDDEVVMPTFKDVDETVYAKKACNVRNSCTTKTNNNKIGSLLEGEKLKRTGISTEWSRIIYNGKVAYVASSLLTTEEPVDNTVVNEVTNEVANEVDTELADIKENVGVLPEVGNNIAVNIYFVITAIAVAIVSGSLYYMNKK